MFKEFITGVDTPYRGHGGCQSCADGEHGPAPVLQGGVQDVGGVHKQVRAEHIGHRGTLSGELGELLLGDLPGEVGVGLGETDLGQAVQACRAGEGLSQEDDLRVGGVDFRDQPLPEVRRLGVGVVHAEGGHSQIHPELHHTVDLLVDLLRRVVEVQGIDVLVLLRWVLGIGDGAIGEHGEELGVLLGPGVIRGCLQGQVEGDLQIQFLSTCQQFLEVLDGAQIRVHGIMATVLGADGPGGTDIMRFRGQRVIAALAVDFTDGVDRGEVDGVKTHRSYAVQGLGGGGEGAVDRLAVGIPATGGAWEEFVPGVDQSITTINPDLQVLTAGQQLAQWVALQELQCGCRKTRGDPGAEITIATK